MIQEQGPKTLALVQERIEAAKAREQEALPPVLADVENDGNRGARPSRDPLASIDAAADAQHARAVAGLVEAVAGLHVDEVLALVRIAGGRPFGLTWGAWRPPPRKRANVTSTARLPGAGKIHLTIDLDANGQPCAVWVEVHKEGSIVRGMLDCVAALASQALQHGASIQEVAARMIGVRFEPDGAVEGHETVTRCLSIVDLLGQMIAAEMTDERERRAR